MNENGSSHLAEILERSESELLADWIKEQLQTLDAHGSRIKEAELLDQSRELLQGLTAAVQRSHEFEAEKPEWSGVREALGRITRARSRQGFTSTETAMFIFSLKQPLFQRLRQDLAGDPHKLAGEIGMASLLLDRLGLYTTELYQQSRDEVIARQQQEMLELSTPVAKLWQGILALPLIGTLDSARTSSSWRACSRKSCGRVQKLPSSTSQACRRWIRCRTALA